MNNKVTSIAICGVGGQGILLTGTILAHAALLNGFDVKKSEVHGMAQRGGSVISQVRYGKKVYSPLIPNGSARMIISFEKMEVLRYIHMLDPEEGIIIINDYKISPASVLLGKDKYPENIEELLKGKVHGLYMVDGYTAAKKIGKPKVLNVIMLGIASKFLDIPLERFKDAIKECVAPKYYEDNLLAFENGLQISTTLTPTY